MHTKTRTVLFAFCTLLLASLPVVTTAMESNSFRLYHEFPNYGERVARGSASFNLNEDGLTWFKTPAASTSFQITPAPASTSSASSAAAGETEEPTDRDRSGLREESIDRRNAGEPESAPETPPPDEPTRPAAPSQPGSQPEPPAVVQPPVVTPEPDVPDAPESIVLRTIRELEAETAVALVGSGTLLPDSRIAYWRDDESLRRLIQQAMASSGTMQCPIVSADTQEDHLLIILLLFLILVVQLLLYHSYTNVGHDIELLLGDEKEKKCTFYGRVFRGEKPVKQNGSSQKNSSTPKQKPPSK